MTEHNLPPDVHTSDPRAPWNETKRPRKLTCVECKETAIEGEDSIKGWEALLLEGALENVTCPDCKGGTTFREAGWGDGEEAD